MPHLSKLDRLTEVRDKLVELRAGGLTIDEIIAAVRRAFPNLPAGALPARSGFGLVLHRVDAAIAEGRKQRDIAIAGAVLRWKPLTLSATAAKHPSPALPQPATGSRSGAR